MPDSQHNSVQSVYDSYERDARDVPTDESQASTGKGKGKSYEKWTKTEEKLLVDLWVEHHDMLESKESRKTWGLIVEELNTRGQCSKTVEKCMLNLRCFSLCIKKKKRTYVQSKQCHSQ